MGNAIVKTDISDLTVSTDYFEFMKDELFKQKVFKFEGLKKDFEFHVREAGKTYLAQAELVAQVHGEFGEKGMLAFCSGLGISRRHGFYLKKIHETKSEETAEVLEVLAFRKYIAFLPVLDEDGVSLGTKGLELPDGGHISLEELSKLPSKKVVDLVKKLKETTALLEQQKRETKSAVDDCHKETEKVDSKEKELKAMKARLARADLLSFHRKLNVAENLFRAVLRELADIFAAELPDYEDTKLRTEISKMSNRVLNVIREHDGDPLIDLDGEF